MCFIVLGLFRFWDFLIFFVFVFGGISRNGLYMRDLRLKNFSAYKSSLRDLIFKWTLRGKNAISDMIKPWKPSL